MIPTSLGSISWVFGSDCIGPPLIGPMPRVRALMNQRLDRPSALTKARLFGEKSKASCDPDVTKPAETVAVRVRVLMLEPQRRRQQPHVSVVVLFGMRTQ